MVDGSRNIKRSLSISFLFLVCFSANVLRVQKIAILFRDIDSLRSVDNNVTNSTHPGELLREMNSLQAVVDNNAPNTEYGKTLNTVFSFQCGEKQQQQQYPVASSIHNGTINGKTVLCEHLETPLSVHSGKVPPECMPTLVLLPSFPTSGNELATSLFKLHTGLVTGAIYRVESGNNDPVYNWLPNPNRFFIARKAACDNKTLKMPHSGQVALLKTHSEFRKHFRNKTGPAYVVRILRNPGDHIIRNSARWMGRGPNKNDNFRAFAEKAKKQCDTLLLNKGWGAYRWARFHKSYRENTKKFSIPNIILKYERMTDPKYSKKAMTDILDFIGEENKFDVDYAQTLKPIKYVHGTLFKEFCGLDNARKLHEITKAESEPAGYSFDYETGVWTVN